MKFSTSVLRLLKELLCRGFYAVTEGRDDTDAVLTAEAEKLLPPVEDPSDDDDGDDAGRDSRGGGNGGASEHSDDPLVHGPDVRGSNGRGTNRKRQSAYNYLPFFSSSSSS